MNRRFTALGRLFARCLSEEHGGEVMEYALVLGLLGLGAYAVAETVGVKFRDMWQRLDERAGKVLSTAARVSSGCPGSLPVDGEVASGGFPLGRPGWITRAPSLDAAGAPPDDSRTLADVVSPPRVFARPAGVAASSARARSLLPGPPPKPADQFCARRW